MSAAQMAIFSNAILGTFFLSLGILILMPLGQNPNMTCAERWIVRVSFAVICFGESIRHLYLAGRETYGHMTPSQDSPMSIIPNVIMVSVIPILFAVAWRMTRRAYRNNGDGD